MDNPTGSLACRDSFLSLPKHLSFHWECFVCTQPLPAHSCPVYHLTLHPGALESACLTLGGWVTSPACFVFLFRVGVICVYPFICHFMTFITCACLVPQQGAKLPKVVTTSPLSLSPPPLFTVEGRRLPVQVRSCCKQK